MTRGGAKRGGTAGATRAKTAATGMKVAAVKKKKADIKIAKAVVAKKYSTKNIMKAYKPAPKKKAVAKKQSDWDLGKAYMKDKGAYTAVAKSKRVRSK